MLYLFHKNGNYQPCFLKRFKSRKALNAWIDADLKSMRNMYPEQRWRRRDYLIAKQVKL